MIKKQMQISERKNEKLVDLIFMEVLKTGEQINKKQIVGNSESSKLRMMNTNWLRMKSVKHKKGCNVYHKNYKKMENFISTREKEKTK